MEQTEKQNITKIIGEVFDKNNSSFELHLSKIFGRSNILFHILLFKIVGLHLGAESCKAVGCSNDQLWPSQLSF